NPAEPSRPPQTFRPTEQAAGKASGGLFLSSSRPELERLPFGLRTRPIRTRRACEGSRPLTLAGASSLAGEAATWCATHSFSAPGDLAHVPRSKWRSERTPEDSKLLVFPVVLPVAQSDWGRRFDLA